jgi:dipeptidyl aminopeptidase/acylaminoacyl peptidase
MKEPRTMRDRFGPWSTALGDGPSTHLSTFWKRRLALLGAARSAALSPSRRQRILVCGAALLALMLPTLHLVSAEGPGAAKAPDAGRIYVRANFDTGDGNDETLKGIFAIDPETLTRTRLCDDFAFFCRISPDGRKAALSRTGWTGPDHHEIDGAGVWTLDVGGKGEKGKIADFGGTISWSPDSKQIIVSKSRPGGNENEPRRNETWRLNIDGTAAIRLKVPDTDEIDDWSPDGQWLVAVSDRDAPHGSGYQLYLMRPDGTAQRRLTEGRGLNVYPRFSPDSREIAYLHQERGRNSLWIVNLDSGGRRLLVQEQGNENVGELCWSPDGKRLIYEIENWEQDERGKHSSPDFRKSDPRLVIIDRDGTNNRRLKLPPARWLENNDWR